MTAQDLLQVRISVLGPVRAWVDGQPVDLAGPKQRSVLVRLVLAHGDVVSVDRLIEDLWAGEPPPKALAALQAYISHLRRVLEPGRERRAAARVIVSAAPGYCLRLPDEAVDVWSLESGIAAAEQCSDPQQRAALLEDLVAAWTGDPYVEVRDALWAAPEVARLAELRLSVTEAHAAAQSALGQHGVVARVLEPHVRDHPDREAAACLLAVARYRSGHQTAALDVLRRTTSYLTDELGLEPGRALRDLERDILRHADHLDPIAVAPAPVSAPPDVPDASATRGRADELAAIDAAAAAAVRGGLRVVWIGGEAGAGKTTVVEAAATRLRKAGWTVVAGRSPEVDGAPPGWAWTEVLETFTATLPPRQSAALAPLLHDGRAVSEQTAEGTVFWIAHALAEVLGQAAERAPLLIVLDDLHRTDGLTLELLRLTADRLGAGRVLVIGTYRPSESGAELGQARAALANHTAAHLTLSGLDDAALTALATDCGLPAVTRETLRLLRERTGGNPLFVRELARLMVAEGVDAAHGGIPAGVGDVVRRRLARLPPQTATALRQAAVLGREVDITLLGELARSDDDELLDALEPAVLTGLLDEPAPGRIRFAHNLIRDTLYEDTSVLRRSRLHAAALDLLRASGHGDAASLAYHAVAAATTETAAEAAGFAMKAAREADGVGAPVEAARQWRAAVGMFELSGADHASAVPARCGLIAALAQAGDAIGSREELHHTMVAVGDHDVLAVQALTASDSPLVWRVRDGDLIDHAIVDPLRRVLGREQPPQVRARLLLTLFTELEGVDHDSALAAAEEALRLARAVHAQHPAGNQRLLCAALNVRAFASLGPDLAHERESIVAELLSVAEAYDAIDYQAVAHWFAFLDASARSDLAGAAAHADQAVARAGTGQLGFLLGVLDVFGAQLAVLAGRTDEGERGYIAVSAKLAEYGVANGAHIGIVGRVSANLVRGSLAPMADDLVAVHRFVSKIIADGAAIALHQAGRVEEAQQIWAERIPIERSFYFVAMATLRAHAAVAMGDLAVATATAAELLPYSGRFAGLDNGTLLTGPVDAALAAVAEATGDTAAAARYRRAAAELTERLRTAAQALID
ncbi:transcriptional regulator [Mycobacterium sp. Root265]|uniref:BTAD domain-containing putative transcriptional regulator n=1 Tax=Mycobacterium sp. Root265 TaxID=1736504 RepID=UPI00070AE866|nr:BTAD domain-containing putative transcriptional regulator [Mycobacterium sp. Root265]KRD14126.1 transcriptional regulator [Mycobacterium sp. Root265]